MHDLAGLAVAALRDVGVKPCALDGSEAVGGEIFDSANLGTFGVFDGSGAGADGFAILVHGAGAAEGHAASEFCAGETEDVADVPEQRHVGIAVERPWNSIHFELDHCDLKPKLAGNFGSQCIVLAVKTAKWNLRRTCASNEHDE